MQFLFHPLLLLCLTWNNPCVGHIISLYQVNANGKVGPALQHYLHVLTLVLRSSGFITVFPTLSKQLVKPDVGSSTRPLQIRVRL